MHVSTRKIAEELRRAEDSVIGYALFSKSTAIIEVLRGKGWKDLFHSEDPEIVSEVLDKSKGSLLLNAGCLAGNLDFVKGAVNSGLFDIDEDKYMTTFTPLRTAILAGREEIVAFLVESGASIGRTYWDFSKLLCEAVDTGNPAIVRSLMAPGDEPVRVWMDQVKEPIKKAIANGSSACLQVLLKNDINCTSADWDNCLGYIIQSAIATRQPRMVSLLWANDCLRKVLAPHLEEIMRMALKSDNLPLFLKFEALSPETAMAHVDWTMEAARIGRDEFISCFCMEGRGINQADSEGITPLMVMSSRGDRASVRLLVEAGADVHATDDRGRTALHWAVSKSKRFVSVEELNDKDWAEGLAECVKILVENGADPKKKDRDGESAYAIAKTSGIQLKRPRRAKATQD